MIRVTIDVFCDGYRCLNWTFGTVSNRVKAKEARENARENSWRRQFSNGKLIDVCPECYKTKNFEHY